jgi:hypothetical protein
MYFFGNRISFYGIGISMFLYYSYRSAEYLCKAAIDLTIFIDIVHMIIMKYLDL